MTAHARLGASSAHRWMACPGSVLLTADMPNTSSAFAEEGTRAHDLAELCLRNNMDSTDLPDSDEWAQYPQDMREHVQTYIDYVRAVAFETGGELFIEQRVDYSEYVPGGFGTADAIILSDNELIVIDLKYGAGVAVYAEGNKQAMLYSLGAYLEHELTHDIERIRNVIVQPRINSHIDEHDVSVDELLAFAETARQCASLALKEDAPLVPGESQCRWCLAKAVCRARAEKNLATARAEFDEPMPKPAKLDIDEIAELLPKLDDLTAWAKDIKEYALQLAVTGASIPNHKVVAGRSVRKWKQSAIDVIAELPESDKLFERKLVGIGKAEKVLGKSSELIAELTEKPDGKPTLVPASDKRAPIQGAQSAADDFK